MANLQTLKQVKEENLELKNQIDVTSTNFGTVILPEKICPHCGGIEWYSYVDKRDRHIYYICKVRKREIGIKYNATHRDKTALYRNIHKKKITLYQKGYYKANKDKISETNKFYVEKHKEEVRERKQKYHEAHKDELSNYRKEYCKTHKKKYYKQEYISREKRSNDYVEKMRERDKKKRKTESYKIAQKVYNKKRIEALKDNYIINLMCNSHELGVIIDRKKVTKEQIEKYKQHLIALRTLKIKENEYR